MDQNSDAFPTSSQSIGITGKLPKTAALMFDRVVTYGIEPCPAPIGWSPFTFGQEGGRKKKFRFILDGGKVSLIEDRDSEQPTLYKVPNVEAAFAVAADCTMRLMVDELQDELGLAASPIYHSVEEYESEVKPGDYAVVAACLENLELVDEESMDWKQVIEFRNDKMSRQNYRRMVHWFDGSMAKKSPSFIQEEIQLKIENYEKALRKHGIKTSIGFLTDVLDPKVLLAGAAVAGVASLSLDAVLGVLAGSGITLANVAVKTLKNYYDYKSSIASERGELAYVFQVREKFGHQRTRLKQGG